MSKSKSKSKSKLRDSNPKSDVLGDTSHKTGASQRGSQQDLPEASDSERLCTRLYETELKRLHIELVKLQEWIRHARQRVVILFEGRDAAGKGGTIKRITEPLNPRFCRIVALDKPTEHEQTLWYFQRYVLHLPGAGEMVLFDRSWYNRAGIERVMGFCDEQDYNEFSQSCPEFERLLIRSGIILIKYWFSISNEEQQRRFKSRLNTPTKRWKLSPMDLESIARWEEFSRAKDEMLAFSDIPEAPWHVVQADDKKRARLNCIRHLLELIPYNSVPRDPIEIPGRPKENGDYTRPPLTDQRFVPNHY